MKKEHEVEEKIMHVCDLVEFLGFERKKILKMCQESVIPATKIGGQWIIKYTRLMKWLDANEGKVIEF